MADGDPRFELEAIRPLVTHDRANGRHLVVTFTCPVSRTHVNAQVTADAPSGAGALGGLGSAVAARAKQTAWMQLRYQVNRTLYSALGGPLASIATTAVDTVMTGLAGQGGASGAPQALSRAEHDRLLVEAFRGVSGAFVWANGRWVHGSAAGALLSPFDKQLRDHPLASSYDREVAARISLEVALAHDGVADAERSRLDDALAAIGGGSGTSVAALSKRPPLSRAELAEVSPGPVRITLLALGWAMAFADERFDPREGARLDAIAAGLGVTDADRDRARDLSRAWILDQWFEQAFAWGSHDATLREQAVALGARLGMSRDEVEVAEAKFQRRRAG